MIGGYAQLAYGFNYYGTVGSNRDEFVVVRKMNKVDWLDEPEQGGLGGDALPQPLPQGAGGRGAAPRRGGARGRAAAGPPPGAAPAERQT